MSEVKSRTVSGSLVLDLLGPLGREGGEAVLQAVQEQPQIPARLVLNFLGAGPISTAGLGGVLWAVRLVAKTGGTSAAFGLSEHFRKVFHIMGLTQYVRICLDEASALQD
ncbi:MAG: STAS domain-containing protein [Symbiobacteriia bacterium]